MMQLRKLLLIRALTKVLNVQGLVFSGEFNVKHMENALYFFAVCLIKLPRDVNTVGVSHSNIVREIDILRLWHNYSYHSTTNFNRNYSTNCKFLQLLNMPFT